MNWDFFFISYIIHNSAVVSESQCISCTQRNEKQKQGHDYHVVIWKVNTFVHGFRLYHMVAKPIRTLAAFSY